MYFFLAPAMSIVQTLSAPSMRATMASVSILIQVLVGGVIGVQVLGILSDALTPLLGNNSLALRLSIALVSLLALWSAAHFWLAGRSIRQDVLEATSEREKPAKTTSSDKMESDPCPNRAI
jgi:hypothetical protein